MQRLIITLFALLAMVQVIDAQSVRTGVFTLADLYQNKEKTQVVEVQPEAEVKSEQEKKALEKNEQVKEEEVTGIYMPPNLKVDIEFVDDDGTGVLNALEKAKVRLSVSNSGGNANGVKVTMLPEADYAGLSIDENTKTINIPSNNTTVVEFPIQAGIDVATSKDTRLNIKVYEPLGYDIEAVLTLPTMEYLKSRLILNGVTSILDSGIGLLARNGNPDGKVQAGDIVNVTVLLQNAGIGNASNITYTVTSKDPNVILYTDRGPVEVLSGNLNDMYPGQTEELSFRVSPTNRYNNTGEHLPVYITLEEETGLGNLASSVIPIPFDADPIKPEVVSVNADVDRMMAEIGRSTVSSQDDRVNMGKQQFRDIKIAPMGTPVYDNAIAIVIGAEKYADKNIPAAPYSSRDAQIMAEYFKTSMGVGNVTVITDESVTGMEMNMMFDSKRGRLARMVQPDVTDVFVYYSGHGVPMEDEDGGQDVKLIPYDVGKEWIKDYGFSLNKMYSDLAAINARSVTVILDACFSGGSRPSERYKSESVANQKMVICDPTEMEQPWLDNPAFRVFTSSRGDQTSQGRDLSQSGLFTYYLATGLQGDADKDQDGIVMMSELVSFVTENVHKESDGSQTPQYYGSDDFIMEKIK